MEPIALISDIHAQREALEAVWRAIDTAGIERVWCLGDVVGRGPDPVWCLSQVEARCELVLAGNHDRVVSGADPMEWIGWHEPISRWTARTIGPEGCARLRQLSSIDEREGICCVHGSPHDHAWEFIDSLAPATIALAATTAPLVCVGHTHRPAAWRERRRGVVAECPTDSVRRDKGRLLINPGAVAGGEWGASWACIEDERITWHTESYDRAPAASRLAATGFGPYLSALGMR